MDPRISDLADLPSPQTPRPLGEGRSRRHIASWVRDSKREMGEEPSRDTAMPCPHGCPHPTLLRGRRDREYRAVRTNIHAGAVEGERPRRDDVEYAGRGGQQ